MSAERRPGSGRRRRRLAGLAVLVGCMVAAGGAAFTVMALLGVRTQILAVRDDVRRGTAALLSGDPATAASAFERARGRAAASQLRLSSPPLRAAGLTPVVREQVETTRALVSATGLVARAAEEVATGVLDLNGGVAAIAPSDGRFRVDALRALQPRLRRAATLATRAKTMAEAADHPLLLPQVRAGRTAMLAELGPAVRTLETSAALADGLPAFLGGDGARRYLFGAATPAELRGTGGLIGAYAPMTVRDGAVSFGTFVPASTLPLAVDDPPAPPAADYERRYGAFAAAGHWSNINMTPDFPTAATAIERLYARTVGDRVDGTVVADPFALQLLLEATGPVEVDGAGTIRADTVVDYLTHDSYVELPDPQARKAVLGRVAVAVFEQFLRSEVAPQRKGRVLADAVGGGHVLLHSRDDDIQAALVRAHAAGQLLDTDDDYVAVIANNLAGNKVDYFAERQVDYHVDLRPDRTARARLDVGIANAAPARGLPTYVIGPSAERYAPGENVMLLSVFCSTSCRGDGYRVDGEPAGIGQHAELGRQVLPATVRVPAGGNRDLAYEWELMSAWRPAGDGGTYRLTLQGQPTVRATPASVRIRVPEGMEVARATDGARVSDREVTWSGTLGRMVQIELGFTPRHGLWQRVRAVLNRPLL